MYCLRIFFFEKSESKMYYSILIIFTLENIQQYTCTFKLGTFSQSHIAGRVGASSFVRPGLDSAAFVPYNVSLFSFKFHYIKEKFIK